MPPLTTPLKHHPRIALEDAGPFPLFIIGKDRGNPDRAPIIIPIPNWSAVIRAANPLGSLAMSSIKNDGIVATSALYNNVMNLPMIAKTNIEIQKQNIRRGLL
jgi:hypothetical protein